jgi:hypothetical protein
MYACLVGLFFLERYGIPFMSLMAQQDSVLCAKPLKSTGVQNTSVDTKVTVALTMGRTPRQRQLTGCRRHLPLRQATSCSCSMYLTLAMKEAEDSGGETTAPDWQLSLRADATADDNNDNKGNSDGDSGGGFGGGGSDKDNGGDTHTTIN